MAYRQRPARKGRLPDLQSSQPTCSSVHNLQEPELPTHAPNRRRCVGRRRHQLARHGRQRSCRHVQLRLADAMQEEAVRPQEWGYSQHGPSPTAPKGGGGMLQSDLPFRVLVTVLYIPISCQLSIPDHSRPQLSTNAPSTVDARPLPISSEIASGCVNSGFCDADHET